MKIDVYFDTICPWCWVGKRNLEKALEKWDGEEIQVSYKTFLLDETIPKEGVAAEGRLQKKYGMTDHQTKEYIGRLVQYGKDSGVEFNYDLIKITPNTIASHVLINMIEEDRKSKIIERIFYEFFNKGQDIGDVGVLKSICVEFDILPADFDKDLANLEKSQNVISEVYAARYRGVTSVPFYLINDKYQISGAQKPDVITQGLNKIVMMEKELI